MEGERRENTIECMRYQSRRSRFKVKSSSLLGSLLFYNYSKIVRAFSMLTTFYENIYPRHRAPTE